MSSRVDDVNDEQDETMNMDMRMRMTMIMTPSLTPRVRNMCQEDEEKEDDQRVETARMPLLSLALCYLYHQHLGYY